MSSVRISRKAAKALQALVAALRDGGGIGSADTRALAELEAALTPRKPKPARTERLQEKRGKRAGKNAETAALREEALRRAGGDSGWCECGCGRRFHPWSPAEMDHAESRRVPQKLSNVWMLARVCHALRTNNRPSRGFWLERWIAHCERHGYSREAAKARRELEAEALVQKAAETSGVRDV